MAKKLKDLVEQSQPEEVDERIRILMRENARLRRKQDARESGWDLIRGVMESVYSAPSELRVRKPKKSRKSSEEVMVAHLTDIHYGKRTKTYNTAMCEERMLYLAEGISEILDLRRKTAKIDHGHILLGGDMIEGQGIFPGQAHELDADIVSQSLKEGPEVVANFIMQMLELFPTLTVTGVPGNHGLVNRFGAQRFNADSLFYEVVRQMVNFAGGVKDRVQWDLPFDREEGDEWYARFNIVGPHEGMLVHGDQIRGQLGFSWYGVGKKVGGWRACSETSGFQFLFMGHFHTHGAFDLNDTTVLSTGSVESTNAYALENMAAAGRPKQRLCFFNESWGLLADYPIHLDRKR